MAKPKINGAPIVAEQIHDPAVDAPTLPPIPEPAYAPDAKPLPTLVSVVLLKPHTHAGVDYPAGAEIDVSPSTRDWLVAHDVIKGKKA